MANRDTPHGFEFAYTLHGGPPAVMHFPVGSGTDVYKGDIVIMSTSGLIPKSTGSDWDKNVTDGDWVVGVANGHSPSGVESTGIPVYVDLRSTVFKVQVSTTTIAFATSNLLQVFESTWTQGSTRTGLSAHEINGTTGMHCRYIGKVLDSNFSTSGGFQELYVVINPPGGDIFTHGASTQ